jgi:DNA-binding CsgD family transcriptional regulator
MTGALSIPSHSTPADHRSLVWSRGDSPSRPAAQAGDAGDAETLSALIGDIYAAALDPSRWVAVLRKARGLVGGSAAALFAKDMFTKGLEVYYDDGGLDPHYKRLYFEEYANLDPCTAGHVSAEIEEPVSTVDLLPYDEFLKTRFYQEWARPQGLVDFVCAVLDKSATGAAMFGIFRHERDGLADAEARRRMRLIVPHLRQALALGRIVDGKTAETAMFADALDGLAAGMFLVDAAGRLVHANASGRALLDERSVLRTSGGKLVATEAKSASALSEILADAGNGAALPGRGLAVALSARDGAHHVAHVLPVVSGTPRSAGTRSAAAAALLVHKVALEVASSPEAIARLYGLTPGELRVLGAIVDIGGVPETAEALGIGEATVKTHLHRLFGKTGATRQADLVKLVAAFANPLVGRAKAPAPAGRALVGQPQPSATFPAAPREALQ